MNSIRLKAFPGSKKPRIEEITENKLNVYVREPREHNAANQAILKAVADYYNIPEKKLRMVSGHHGLNKTIQILE